MVGILAILLAPASFARSCDLVPRELKTATGFEVTMAEVLMPFSALIDSIDLDENETAIVLTYNASRYLTVRGEILRQPEIFRPLSEALSDDSTALENLRSQIGTGDDIAIEVRFALPANEKGLEVPFRFPDQVAGSGTNKFKKSQEEIKKVRESLGLPKDGVNSKAVGPAYNVVLPPKRGRRALLRYLASDLGRDSLSLLSVTARNVDAVAKHLTSAEKAMLDDSANCAGLESLFWTLTDVGSNVSDWHFNGRYRDRDARVGPDEWGFELKYERGLKAAGRTLDVGKPIEGLADLFADRRRRSQLRRFALSAAYEAVEDYSFRGPLPQALMLSGSDKWVAAAAYGMSPDPPGLRKSEVPPPRKMRWDLSLAYESLLEDESVLRTDHRLIAKAGVSFRADFMGETSFELVWANEPEFLADEEFDHNLSARLGFSYKFGRKK